MIYSYIKVKLYNTFTKKIEEVKTAENDHLKIYVCGPTVYDRAHLGNARSVVVYDLLYRLFVKIFKKVTYVRNITDVDDKINNSAKEQKISIQQLTKKYTEFFHNDMKALNVLDPTHQPKATEHINDMIVIIEKLIKKNHAYVSENHVLFDVNSFEDYGKLSNRTLDEMIAGARVEIAKYKKNPLDFVLWKPADQEDDPSSMFDSPWGVGRPGWHIECSAMSSKYLGNNFDIHGGGSDLQFPHHENEIAQSKCAHENSYYAKYWIHNGFLTVDKEKMSKSLKNFITVKDLLDKNINGVVIRFLLLSSHYRKPLDFNKKILDDSKKTIEKFYEIIDKKDLELIDKSIPEIVISYLADDLNISKVNAYLHELVKKIKNSNDLNLKKDFLNTLDFIGLIDEKLIKEKQKNNPHVSTYKTEISAKQNENYTAFSYSQEVKDKNNIEIDQNYINSQIELRLKYKKEKNFQKADEIREDLLQKGIILEDISGQKTIWKK